MCPHPCSNSLRVQSFPLFFWRSVLPSLPSCVRSPAITSMFCPITFHQSIPSECFLRRHQLEVIFTTVGNSHFLLHYFSVIILNNWILTHLGLLCYVYPYTPLFSIMQQLPISKLYSLFQMSIFVDIKIDPPDFFCSVFFPIKF